MELFSTKAEAIEYLLLDYLAQAEEPMGSWSLYEMLQFKGYQVSVATIGRVLKTFDIQGLTELVKQRGRALTTRGREYARELSERVERARLQNRLLELSQPRDLKELMDLLQARSALEHEVARLAAMRASPRHIEAIRQSLEEHQRSVSEKTDPTAAALKFHQAVAKASQNRFLATILDLLIYEESKVEARITRLITRERGSEYVAQHALIHEAIARRNTEEAERRMSEHMDALLRAIQEQSHLVEAWMSTGEAHHS